MVARSFTKDKLEAVELDDASDRPGSQVAGRCAYCVPGGNQKLSSNEPYEECLIKMLGSAERKQVALTLYRAGHEDGLFTKQCPMSSDHAYDDCPFYEDESDIPDE